MKIFSARLKQLRGAASQAEFANKLGISQVTYGRYELGTREPELEALNHIGFVCGVTIDWLFGRETFGSRLRQSREWAGYSVKELASKLNLSEDYVLRLEGGVDPPTDGMYYQCAKVLGTTVEWLRDGKVQPGQAAKSGPCAECKRKDSEIEKQRAQIERLEKIIDKLMK